MDARVLEKPCMQPLSAAVLERVGANIHRCWQCIKCTSGCPLAEQFDVAPHQMMRALQFGDARVLESRTIWLCASCHTCATRCPRGIDVTSVMDALRWESRRRGVRPGIPDIPKFNTIFMRLVGFFGRVPEALLMAAFNMVRGKPMHEAKLGWQLFRRGRLGLVPRVVRRPSSVAPVADSANKVGYFPGCASEGSAFEYDRTARAAARALGIELVEPKGWTCCGASSAHSSDPVKATAMPLRTIATIERIALKTVTSPCSSCYSRLKFAAHEANADPSKARLADMPDHRYGGTVEVQHLLDTFMERAGAKGIAQRVRRPLRGLKVACYYGCLITRPSRVTGAEHPEYPMKMDALVRALGAEPVAWSSKTDCCGGSLGLTQTEASLKLTARVLANARACGADVVASMCPLCQMNLDARQTRLPDTPIPILHTTQLMLLAFGEEERTVLLDRALVDSRPLLRAKGVLGV